MDEGTSAARKLSMNEVTNLLGRAKKQEMVASKHDDVFQPHYRELLALLDEKVDSVVIGDVELFVFQRPDRDSMYIRPKRGFVPCGWFTREQLKGGK